MNNLNKYLPKNLWEYGAWFFLISSISIGIYGLFVIPIIETPLGWDNIALEAGRELALAGLVFFAMGMVKELQLKVK